jgi:hypothetical protein
MEEAAVVPGFCLFCMRGGNAINKQSQSSAIWKRLKLNEESKAGICDENKMSILILLNDYGKFL